MFTLYVVMVDAAQGFLRDFSGVATSGPGSGRPAVIERIEIAVLDIESGATEVPSVGNTTAPATKCSTSTRSR